MTRLGGTRQLGGVGLNNTISMLQSEGGIFMPPSNGGPNGLLNGLQSYWDLDTNGSIPDLEGAIPGTILGATFTASGKINGGYDFDMINDRISMANNLGETGTGAFSMSIWVKYTTAGNHMILGKQLDSGTFAGYMLWHNTTPDRLSFSVVSTGANQIQVTTTTQTRDNIFHNIVVTYDGSKTAAGCNMYIDGAKQTLTVDLDTLTGSISSTANFLIGARNNANLPFGGTADETGKWNVELTQAQATALFNGNAGLPHSSFTL